jgi:hypothetical protein
MPALVPLVRRTVPMSIEIVGLELFLQPEDDDSNSNSSEYDSYAPDSFKLIQAKRRNNSDNKEDLEDSFANDSQLIDLRQPSPASDPYYESASSSFSSEDSSSSSSSSFDDDMDDSLHHGNYQKKFVVTSRKPTLRTMIPSKSLVSTLKRRSSLDNGNFVLFSTDVMVTQRMNNGGANAAA